MPDRLSRPTSHAVLDADNRHAGPLPLLQRSDLDRSIPDRFERIVSLGPSRVAIRSGGRDTSYDALQRAASRIARSLTSRLAAVGEPVGLLLAHDERAIAAMLGVLQSGRFYVPLDPSYPQERLSFILRDCGALLVLSDTMHLPLARALAPPGCSVVLVDDCNDSGPCNVPSSISPDAIAAVFYTSGSTGRPKGVVQTHRLVMHRALLDTNGFGLTADDRLLLLSSPSFSNSLRQLFGALLNGAVLCPFTLADHGLREFTAWLERERITIFDAASPVFRRLMAGPGRRDALRHVRLVHLGSDVVTVGDFELFRTHFPVGCRFATTLASNEAGPIRRFFADHATAMPTDAVPVGFPVEDKDVRIVDEDGRLLGPDEVGRIVVASEFLSPGYWGQPDLTAAAFQPDPVDARKRVYVTGDLGVLGSDGCLFFKGRTETRTKIRGVRVELEELDALLGSHPAIDRAVVVTRADRAGENRLVAYVVTRAARLTISDIRQFLTERVPGQMLPSSVVFLDDLPLTPHGKVDRLALHSPDDRRPNVSAPYSAPVDRLERDLIALCESILGVRPIGTRDNLFDLGADSLTLLQLTARIEADFGKALPPAALFTNPTVADLAATLRSDRLPAQWPSLVPVQTTGSRHPFFWIHGDCSTGLLPAYLDPDQPLYGLEHQSQDGAPARYAEVETMAAHYLGEIRTVQPRGPYFLGGYSFGGVLAFELAHQLARDRERVGLLVLLDPPGLVGSHWTKTARSHATERFQDAGTPANEALAQRVRRHVRGLSALTLKARWNYVASRVTEKTIDDLRLREIQRLAHSAIYRTCLAADLRLPRLVRRPYIFHLYERAYAQYSPSPYAGPTLLFTGDLRRHYSAPEWDALLTGRADVHRLDVAHVEMATRRGIALWAPTLTNALADAQTAAATGG